MIPVYQRTGRDCFQCCLASVAEIAYEDALDVDGNPDWLEDTITWAEDRGLRIDWATDPADVPAGATCIMGTEWNGDPERSRRGHSVVSCGPEEIVHDPRVGGSKSYEPPMFWIWFL